LKDLVGRRRRRRFGSFEDKDFIHGWCKTDQSHERCVMFEVQVFDYNNNIIIIIILMNWLKKKKEKKIAKCCCEILDISNESTFVED